LQPIPGIWIQEMARSKANSFCCGGGGGGVLLGGQTRKRVNEVRIQEALATNADYLVTACPYCFIMLEDGAKNLSAGESSLKVVDIAEVLDRALAC
jgi:Fe-S oxidoreductase